MTTVNSCFRVALIAVTFVSIVAITSPALADECIVAEIEWADNYNQQEGNVRLRIKCTSGIDYYVFSVGGYCGTDFLQDEDTLKIWLSQAEAALLSGLPITVYATICQSTTHVLRTLIARRE